MWLHVIGQRGNPLLLCQRHLVAHFRAGEHLQPGLAHPCDDHLAHGGMVLRLEFLVHLFAQQILLRRLPAIQLPVRRVAQVRDLADELPALQPGARQQLVRTLFIAQIQAECRVRAKRQAGRFDAEAPECFRGKGLAAIDELRRVEIRRDLVRHLRHRLEAIAKYTVGAAREFLPA